MQCNLMGDYKIGIATTHVGNIPSSHLCVPVPPPPRTPSISACLSVCLSVYLSLSLTHTHTVSLSLSNSPSLSISHSFTCSFPADNELFKRCDNNIAQMKRERQAGTNLQQGNFQKSPKQSDITQPNASGAGLAYPSQLGPGPQNAMQASAVSGGTLQLQRAQQDQQQKMMMQEKAGTISNRPPAKPVRGESLQVNISRLFPVCTLNPPSSGYRKGACSSESPVTQNLAHPCTQMHTSLILGVVLY